MPRSFEEYVSELDHARSPKRRAAAKALGKMRDGRASPHLIKALIRETQDARTWETQCAMLIALARCGCQAALPVVEELIRTLKCVPMVRDSLGHSFVRLGSRDATDPSRVLQAMRKGEYWLVTGAFSAMGTMRMKFNESITRKIINYVLQNPPPMGTPEHAAHMPQGVAVAAAGWTGDHVKPYLEWCLKQDNEVTLRAARQAIQGKYWKDTDRD